MKIRRLLSAFGLIALLWMPVLAHAQSQNAGQGLEISPPTFELTANPGDDKTVNLNVRNVTSQELVVHTQINDFLAAGEDGQPKILLNDQEQSPYSMKDWIADLPNVTIAAGERKTIPIVFHVPKDASPGGHYAVVRFTGTPPDVGDTGVSLSASVGTLVLANVSGNVTEQASIAELSTSQNNKKRDMFEYGPVDITLRLQNSGNIHIKPKGTIRVTNTFGKEVASFPFNSNGSNVLPQSIRKFQETLHNKLLFGRYKVQADIVYGNDNKIISASHTIWVIPYKLILLVLAAIVLIIFLIRRYNKLVVKRHAKKNSSSDKEGN